MSNRQLVDAKPSLRALSHVLRHPELWPEDFEWDYDSCAHCAIGLSAEVWPQTMGRVCGSEGMAKAFNMKFDDAIEIFTRTRPWLSLFTGGTRPYMVADAIDKYLARAA